MDHRRIIRGQSYFSTKNAIINSDVWIDVFAFLERHDLDGVEIASRQFLRILAVSEKLMPLRRLQLATIIGFPFFVLVGAKSRNGQTVFKLCKPAAVVAALRSCYVEELDIGGTLPTKLLEKLELSTSHITVESLTIHPSPFSNFKRKILRR